MPLYDYRCHHCGETFEVRQKFADKVLTVHEGCGGETGTVDFASGAAIQGNWLVRHRLRPQWQEASRRIEWEIGDEIRFPRRIEERKQEREQVRKQERRHCGEQIGE